MSPGALMVGEESQVQRRGESQVQLSSSMLKSERRPGPQTAPTEPEPWPPTPARR